MRVALLKITALLGSLAFFFGSSPAPAAGAQGQLRKMTVSFSAQAGAFAPMWITNDEGFFEKNGLDGNLVFIRSGPLNAAALVAGNVQAAAMAGPAVLNSNLAGTDLVMIAGIVNTFAFQLVTVKGITSAAQLKGKRVAINRFGAAPDVAARYALRHLGIDPKDVVILQLGEQGARLAAMKAGHAEAGIFLPPITTLAERVGMHVLLDMSDLGAPFQMTGVAASRRFLRENPAEATDFMRAFVEGIHFYKTHKQKSMDVIGKYMRVSDRQALAATYDYFAQKIVPRKPYPTVKGVKALLNLLAKGKPAARSAPPGRFIDDSILKKLDDSGFIDRLYR